MFELELPWWEFVLRGAAIYAFLLVLVRLSGKRTVGQFTPFDLVVVVLLSESVSNALVGGDQSLAGGMISAATLITLNSGLAWLTSHNKTAEKVVEGSEVLLGRDGKVYEDILKRERVSRADFDEALREHDCSLEQMRCAFLESDGKIAVLKK
jgi:uncharacterized membrane protein YcaP (DUF421 family)